jgi:eukaryotic-like serine/threonine-protein kinase
MRVGRYHVVGRLATGGMAEVLLGKILGPAGFEQPVVLKRILPHLAAEPAFKRMFAQEAQMIAHVRHPNVVRVFELLEEEQELFLVMEYLEGETAAGMQRRARAHDVPLPLSLAAYVVAGAAAGLHATHEATDLEGRPQRLVHRDVSPQNLFVTYGGEVKVIDFGIAKAADHVARTSLAGIKGKFSYMSPEQTRGEPLDQRSDIFSLGIVLYELTVGRRLFARANAEKTLRAVCEEPIASPTELEPSYPRSLERICMKALERDPEQRYRSALDMRRDILEALRELHVSPAPEEDLSRLMRELFPDRIEEKNAMLRTVQAGLEPKRLPPADTDEEVRIPTVAEGLARRAQEKHRWSALHRFQVGVGLVFAATFGALAFQLTHPGAKVAERPKPIPLGAPSHVDFTIQSEPKGAEVWIGPRLLGTTPIVLQAPASRETLDVELRLSGYLSKTVKIVPDANTELAVELVARKPGS